MVGSANVPLSILITTLRNDDWVSAGRKYLEHSDKLCPFCQQKVPPGFLDELESYFDPKYLNQVRVLNSLRVEVNDWTNGWCSYLDDLVVKGRAADVIELDLLAQTSVNLKTLVSAVQKAKARKLAGIKMYETNLPDPDPHFVIRAYRSLTEIEKSFKKAKSDLQARPAWVYSRPSIEAHLTIVFTALAVSRWIEETTGWTIKKFVKTLRRYRTTYVIVAGRQLTAEKPLPNDVKQALA